jgi:hypothetical protein
MAFSACVLAVFSDLPVDEQPAEGAFGAALALAWAVGGAWRIEFPATKRHLVRLAKEH